MEPPTEREARAAQQQQKPSECREGHHRTGGIGSGFQPHRAAPRPAQPRQRHGLHGEHRKDARHQIQDHTAEQRKNQRLPKRQQRRARQQRAGDVITQPPPALIGQQQHAFKLRVVFGTFGALQGQFQPIRAMAQALRRGVIQKARGAGDEKRFLQAFPPKAGSGQAEPQRIARDNCTRLPRRWAR